MGIQSENVALHTEVNNRLHNDLHSMIVNCNKFDHQIGKERLLKVANQRNFSNPKEEENTELVAN